MQTKEQRKKILVMDDEDMVGEIACQMLEYLGFDAVWVANGEEAVKEYTNPRNGEKGYDAIIMDLTIPGGMGGEEAVGAILAFDPAARVFVSSGYSNDPVMLNFRKHGFTGAIAKPFDLAAMQRILYSLL